MTYMFLKKDSIERIYSGENEDKQIIEFLLQNIFIPIGLQRDLKFFLFLFLPFL